jgi:predicted RNA methylase
MVALTALTLVRSILYKRQHAYKNFSREGFFRCRSDDRKRVRLIRCRLDGWRSTVCPLNDIGSGDGAIVIRAAKKYGVKGVGIEIDQGLVAKARDNAFRENVQDLVEFRAQDAFTVDVSAATVVTLYMLPDFNAKLRPVLDRQLKPGTRVVSHDFDIPGWVPDKVETVKGDFIHDHKVLLFEIR